MAKKPKRTFDGRKALEDAQARRLSGAELRKAIKIAEEYGQLVIAREPRRYVVQPDAFAGDPAPPELRDRVAHGISALMAIGESLNRTKQMLKRHGVVGTINRIAKYPAASKNFEKLKAARLEHLTAEAIVLDYPELFDPKAAEVARRRLGR